MFIYLNDSEVCNKGKKLVTRIIQQKLDDIAQSGGGELVIPAGKYLIGSLNLPSNLILRLEAGAELLASDNIEDYQHIKTCSMAELSYRALLYARGQHNITLCGPGHIEGQDRQWFAAKADEAGYRMPHRERPRMLVLEECEAVTLRDFTIRHSPMWTIHLVCCARVVVDNITIDNDLYLPNTDSLDIDSCQHVRISNCYLSAADDGVCLKTTQKTFGLHQAINNVVVTNSIIRSRGAAVKIGTETFADVENVLVNNITVFDSNRAVALVSRDGGKLRRMMFSNITYECRLCVPHHWGKAEPVGISVRYRDPAITPGNIEDITFNNISGSAHGAFSLYSEIQDAISGVRFSRITLQQLSTEHPDFGCFDIRPPCNPDSPTGMGLDNSYKINLKTMKPYGVDVYQDGIPAFYIVGTSDVTIKDLTLLRDNPQGKEWNQYNIVMLPAPDHK